MNNMMEIHDDEGNLYYWSCVENCLKKINKNSPLHYINIKDIVTNDEDKLLLLTED
jgi:hypothetical protein